MFPPDEPGMAVDINSNVSHSPNVPPSPTAEVEKADEADTPNPEDKREYLAVPAECRFDVLNNKGIIISDLELESISHAESVEMSVEEHHAVVPMAYTSDQLTCHDVQSHEDCQSAVACGDLSVFMMESEEHHGALLSDRLSILAQRLQRLREAPSSTRDEIMPPGDRPRSTPCGLAMSRRTPAGKGAVQQDCHVASVQSVPAPALCHEGQWSRRDPGHWSPSRACRVGSGGIERGVHLHDGHGEDFQRQADGATWPRRDEVRDGPLDSAGASQREARRGLDGGSIMLGLNGEEDGDDKEPIAPEDQEQGEDHPCEGGHPPALGSTCIGGHEGLSGQDEPGHEHHLGGVGGSDQGHSREEEEHQERGDQSRTGRVMALWNALKGLQSRMWKKEEESCLDRLEAGPGDAVTTSLSPARQPSPMDPMDHPTRIMSTTMEPIALPVFRALRR